MNKLWFIVILFLFSLCGFSQRVKTPSVHTQSHIRFTENKNQWNSSISHKAQLDGGALFIEKSGKLTYHLYDKDNYRARHLGKSLSPTLKLHAYAIDFIGSNTNPTISSADAAEDYANFFLGKTSTKWSSNVHHYKTISVAELYNHIDAVYSGGSQSIKYNFIVKPNGNPSDIKIHYSGIDDIRLVKNELHISTSVSESIEQKPFVFQIINGDTVEIPSKYVLHKDVVSFKLLKNYDHSKDLIIDPLLVFAAQSGSTADNFGMTATYDAHGNLYTGGTTFDVGYPTTVGAYDVSYNGNAIDGFTDVVITKYDSSGTFLRYSTYLGGATSSEIVTSLVVDTTDNLCLYGATGSSDFPIVSGCFDSTFNGGTFLHYPQNGTLFGGGTDIYVAKFNSLGTTLMASTYLGGSENDGVNNNINTSLYDSLMFNYGDQFRGEIQVDRNNEIYIVSSTKSSDFPMVNSIDNILNGNQDAVLIKLNTNLTSIVYSTFIGGSNKDCGNALTVDDSLNVYITGGTCSSDFLTTAGSYKLTYNGGKTDGYICKIKYDGSTILNSTFIGTSNYDQSYFIQLDNNEDVFIFGQTQGLMPVTAGVYSKVNSRQFIQKLDNQLATLLASTIIGNSNGQINISPSAFSVDCAGNIYLSGWGGNILSGSSGVFNMPITSNAIQSTTDGHNFYIMVLGPNMSSLLFGSYFGGTQSWEHVDGGTSRFDKKGIIYQSVCAGCQNNDDFPVSPGAWPTALYGSNTNQSTNCNNGVFKIDFELNSAIASIATNTISGCVPLTVNFNNNSTPGHQYLWDFGANDTTSIIFNPVKTFTAAGTYTVNLYVKTSICNNVYDTANVTITVYPSPTSAFTSTFSPCSNTVSTTNTSSGSLAANPYVWDWGDASSTSTLTSPSHTYSANGTYTISLTVTSTQGCVNKMIDSISVFNFTTTITSTTLCGGDSNNLYAQGGTSYTWQPSATVSNSLISNPIVNPTITTIYTVQIDNNSQGYLCSQTLTTQVLVNPKPVANFTISVDSCSNSINFINQTTPSTSAYDWSYATTPFSTVQNPTYVFNPAGTYTIQLIAETSFGCKDTVIKPITVPVNSVSIVPTLTKCYTQTISLSASGGNTYSWQPLTGLTNPTSSTPVCNATATTVYSVTITQNSLYGNVCTKTLTTSVTVYPKIISAFNYTIDPCGNAVQFTDSSYINPINWQWDFGDITGSTQQSPAHFYGSPGTYTVSLIAENSNGCKDTTEHIVSLGGFVLAVSPATLKCEEDTTQLVASGGNYYLWQPSQYISNPNIPNPLAFPPNTTIYTVTIGNITGGDTCKTNLTTTVSVLPFSYNTNSISVTSTTITLGESVAITLNGFTYTGTLIVVPNTNVTTLTNSVVTVTPTKTGEYTVYFIDQNGCRHSLKTIYVVVQTNICDDGVVYLPSGFTPNNDGVNDVLYIRSNFVSDVYLTIYDRWGEKLFETNDIKKGWDGIFKGKLLDQGVYGYYMTFTCNNGQESFKKGNITLMR